MEGDREPQFVTENSGAAVVVTGQEVGLPRMRDAGGNGGGERHSQGKGLSVYCSSSLQTLICHMSHSHGTMAPCLACLTFPILSALNHSPLPLPLTGERRRKSVRGCIISSDLSVINLKVRTGGVGFGHEGVESVLRFHAKRVELLVTRLGDEQQQHEACISIPSCGDGTFQVLGRPSFILSGDALVCRAGTFLAPFSC